MYYCEFVIRGVGTIIFNWEHKSIDQEILNRTATVSPGSLYLEWN